MPSLRGKRPATQPCGVADPLHRRMLTATAIIVVLIGSSAAAAASGASASSPQTLSPHTSTGPAARRSPRPDRADWQKIENAARLRAMALARHRTARFRAFAADLGLRELASLHPLAPGRCATALIYLYNNLLDLEQALPGENWTPLRRAVAKEPSITACAPRPSSSVTSH